MNLKYFKLAHNLNKEYEVILLENEVHFRASLNSISLISVSEEKPEIGVKYNSKEHSITSIQSTISKIKNKSNPKRPTPEKSLQSWIISYALNHGYLLPFDDNITFITSELAIQNNRGKKIVTDILGYDQNTNQLCIIELKSDRQLKRLIEQVNSFEKIVKENYADFFELLSLYDNQLKESIGIRKIIVWPQAKTSPRMELKNENILEITYQIKYDFHRF